MAKDDDALTLSEFLLYQTEDGLARVQVRLQDGLSGSPRSSSPSCAR